MKNLQILANYIRFLFGFVLPLFSIGESISQTAGPSKLETVQYIKNNIIDNPDEFDFNTSFAEDGCTLNLIGKGYDYLAQVDLKIMHIKFVDFGTGRYAIKLKCSAGDCVKIKRQNPSSENGFVYTSDVQFANRIYKSMSHLKSLCVARKELF